MERRRFTREFKLEAVRLIRDLGSDLAFPSYTTSPLSSSYAHRGLFLRDVESDILLHSALQSVQLREGSNLSNIPSRRAPTAITSSCAILALTQFRSSWFIRRRSVWPEADRFCRGRTFGAGTSLRRVIWPSVCPFDQGNVIAARTAASSFATLLSNEATRLARPRLSRGASPVAALRRIIVWNSAMISRASTSAGMLASMAATATVSAFESVSRLPNSERQNSRLSVKRQ